MSAQEEIKWTAESYLEFERSSETKHEYYRDSIRGTALAGASRNHDRIYGNVFASLHGQLRIGDCEVYSSDMRVKISKIDKFTYPDIKIVCGDASVL